MKTHHFIFFQLRYMVRLQLRIIENWNKMHHLNYLWTNYIFLLTFLKYAKHWIFQISQKVQRGKTNFIAEKYLGASLFKIFQYHWEKWIIIIRRSSLKAIKTTRFLFLVFDWQTAWQKTQDRWESNCFGISFSCQFFSKVFFPIRKPF